MAENRCVTNDQCEHRMGKMFAILMGDDGTGGMRGQLTEVQNWQIKKDARDELQKELLAKELKDHNRKVTNRFALLSLVVGILTVILAWRTWIDTRDKVDKGLIKLPTFHSQASEPENARKQAPTEQSGQDFNPSDYQMGGH